MTAMIFIIFQPLETHHNILTRTPQETA